MTDCVGNHEDAEQATVGYLCAKCFSRLRRSILELPAIAAWLHVNIAAGGVPGERVAGSREDPIPLRLDVLDLIGPDSRKFPEPDPEHLPAFLLWEDGVIIGDYPTWREAQAARVEEMRLAGVEWDVIVLLTRPHTRQELRESTVAPEKLAAARERWQIRPTERGGSDQAGTDAMRALAMHWARVVNEESHAPWPDSNDLTGLVNYLAGSLSWIAAQPWVGELIEQVQKVSQEAHRIAPWRPEVRRDRQPCETCGVAAILIHMAEGRSVCERRLGGCGRVIIWDHERKTA